MSAPCLFLSHSGADTDGARRLKRRLLEAPEASRAGLTVWFDKDDLKPGLDWQEQLETAITRGATAFAVLVGSKGVVNWVEREVRLGLARATGDDAIPFVSIVAEGASPEILNALPAFAQQHQGVVDPLNDPLAFAKLLDVALGRSDPKPARLTDEPFVGLRAMTEREADRFFGRATEVAELLDDLRRHRLVAIVADSGAGKSSLAMAGLAPAFRGGALLDGARRGHEDAIWHVVVMRPGGDPVEGLRRGVTEAAERRGLPPDARAGLRRRVTLDDANETAYALRCDLPAGTTETLLIVDQFDELLTETPEAARAPFIDFLLRLAALRSPGGFYVVLTVRVDYFNLCRPYGTLYAELQAGERVVRLKRISDAGLEQAVRAPLRMAGYTDDADRDALAHEMRRDLGDRPGDLALAQMALWTVWRNRRAHGGSLLKAYVDVGGVSGALAQEAEQVRLTKLSEAERTLLPALFVRLVRLGETGGVLRRLAGKDEFDAARGALAEKLASDDHGRLLLVGEGPGSGGARVEVCHEALITQWPWLQNTLNAAAADLRVLDRLMDRAATWNGVPAGAQVRYLATGAERELFAELGERRDAWLSVAERAFIGASNEAFAREAAARRASVRRLRTLVGVLAVAAVALVGVAWVAVRETGVARSEADRAEAQSRIARDLAARAEQQTRLAKRETARADRDFALAKATIDRLLFDVVQGLDNAAGMPVATLRRVLDTTQATVEALVAAEPDDSDLQESRLTMLLNFANVSIRANDVERASDTARAAVVLARRIGETKNDPEHLRELSAALDTLGRAEERADHQPEALKAFEEDLSIERKLAEQEGTSKAWFWVANSLDQVGGKRLHQGDRDGARAAFEEALGIARRLSLVKDYPMGRRALATAIDQLASFKRTTGDLAGARADYEEALGLFREFATDPSDREARFVVAISLRDVADLRRQLGDLAGARSAIEEEVGLDRELARDKSDAEAQHNLAAALLSLGSLLRQVGDRDAGGRSYEEALGVVRAAAGNKTDLQARRDLAAVLETMGMAQRQDGDFAGAGAVFEEDVAVLRAFAKEGGNAQAQIWLAVALFRLGDAKQASGDRAEARTAFEEELSILQRLADAKALTPVQQAWIGGAQARLADLSTAP